MKTIFVSGFGKCHAGAPGARAGRSRGQVGAAVAHEHSSRGRRGILAALDAHRMGHAGIELQRRIAGNVAVLAPVMLQHGAHRLESAAARAARVALCERRCPRALR